MDATPQSQTQQQPQSYVVQAGDTLWEISNQYNVNVQDIVDENSIANADLILPGETFKIPSASSSDSQAHNISDLLPSSAPAVQDTAATQDTAVTQPAQQEAQAQPATVDQTTSATTPQVTPAATGNSVYDEFIANGGTDAMWNSIVMPESGGNPNAVSPMGYRGLGQTLNSWGTGSVANQTAGMIQYANSRYGSIDAAVQFRAANGWW